MVRVIYTLDQRDDGSEGAPVIEIHHIERHVHGNGIAVKVWGELKIAAKEIVYARELMLNTLQVLLLTTETGSHYLIHPQKYVYHKGELDNYASIDILACDSFYEMTANSRTGSSSAPTVLPDDGSIWLNFHALGE